MASFLGVSVVRRGRLRNWFRAGLRGFACFGFKVVGWPGLLVGPEGRGGSLVGPWGRGASSNGLAGSARALRHSE